VTGVQTCALPIFFLLDGNVPITVASRFVRRSGVTYI